MAAVESSGFELFTGALQHEKFCRLTELFPHSTLHPSPTPRPLPEGAPAVLPDTFEFKGEARSTEDFMASTDTSALLVMREGSVCVERYFLTGGPDVQWISWSVAKSFISALVGIAVNEDLIQSIDDAITDYAGTLKGSAYDGVSIRHVLQMSSGARWNEDYSDPSADVHGLDRVMRGESTLEAFVAGMQPETEPGTVCQYNSADTQALGIMLTYATGQSITDYMQEKLYAPLGMEANGYWLLDTAGMELALGGLNLTARDFAKLGELYRNGGAVGATQIVPKAWVEASSGIELSACEPGRVVVGGHVFPFGYGYQWWIPAGSRGEYSAIGIYNQFVYVDPSREVTIVKLSANRTYGTTPYESSNREGETLAFLRAVAAEVAGG